MAEKNSPFGYTKEATPEIGKEYYIDESINSKKYTVKVLATNKLFCKVTAGKESWETMCNRLTEIK